MNLHAKIEIGHSACPHDCPSTCALDVELLPNGRIGRVRGAEDNSYTAGVICAKVARYAERVHHPDRLMHPLRRKGPKGSGQFERISWDDALDITAEAMLTAERRYGPEAVWPYYYAGTMGLVMRDGINRLRPGTDGALACAVMHVLFRDRLANWPYLEKYTDCPRELEAHLKTRTPEWASAITGLSVAEIETFAKMVGTTPKTYFRLGYGFARSRNGPPN